MTILHLEDNPLDAELLEPMFEAEWPGVQVRRAATRDEFMRELAHGTHDLILSDFNLTSFNGFEALKIARVQCPGVPFIFLSGTIGEDRAVEAMQLGASDYVIKDRPKRLLPAMQRALHAAKESRGLRAIEEQLLRVQRLESIGMLAAGIAHDFNNVLAPVLMAVPLLRESVTGSMPQEILNNIEKSVERGAGLVKEILGFAKGVSGEPQLVQPKHLLRDLLNVMRSTFPSGIAIAEQVESTLWPVMANLTQLHQVLLNLCVNARDAMPSGGTLSVRAVNVPVDDKRATPRPDGSSVPCVLFEIADTGTGIPAEVANRIWEPFFTTKGPGKGTGLGLSTVRAIVENHRGTVTMNTVQGRGTTFRVFVPASQDSAVVAPTAATSQAPTGHNELVLIIDDDVNVRDITSVILTRHGYRVMVAGDGAAAISVFGPRSLDVRLVITDMAMPELDGLTLVKVLRKLNPNLRVIGVSGLAEQEMRFKRETGGTWLMKPFSMEALLNAVHDLLSRESPGGDV
jgi:two-component system cell cycle sensor histidine kinase/response regulator CckA